MMQALSQFAFLLLWSLAFIASPVIVLATAMAYAAVVSDGAEMADIFGPFIILLGVFVLIAAVGAIIVSRKPRRGP